MNNAYDVHGKVIVGLAPFSMEPETVRAKATYEKCGSVLEAALRAANTGFCLIEKVVEVSTGATWEFN